jgi:oxygen-independent coproporphyrinogen-3 oxidase
MFALPGRDEEGWRRELATTIALGPQHVSCYQLTFHEGTPFHRKRERGELVEPGESEQAGLFHLTHERLGAAGFDAYEVSNFARGDEHRSRHNLKYWRHAPYLGLGPSAHSFDGRRRWWNLRTFDDWQGAIAEQRRPIADEESLSPQELALEALMLGLRTTDGVDLAAVRARTGLDLGPCNREVLEDLRARGLFRIDGERLLPTLAGLAVADSLPGLFTLPD